MIGAPPAELLGMTHTPDSSARARPLLETGPAIPTPTSLGRQSYTRGGRQQWAQLDRVRVGIEPLSAAEIYLRVGGAFSAGCSSSVAVRSSSFTARSAAFAARSPTFAVR